MIAIVYDVREYRRLLAERVNEGDVVVEIGPHMGASTRSYVAKAGLAVAIDKGEQSKKSFEALGEEHPNLRFVQDDVRGFEAVKKVLELTDRCDVLALDMGGGRYPDTAFKVWATWSGIFKPRDSVIRNRGLAEFVQRAQVLDDSIRRDFPGDGWLSTWGRSVPYRLRKQLEELRYWVDL